MPVPLILAPEKTRGTGTKDLLSQANLAELLRALYPQQDAQLGIPIQLPASEL